MFEAKEVSIVPQFNDRCIDSTPQNYGGSLPLWNTLDVPPRIR